MGKNEENIVETLEDVLGLEENKASENDTNEEETKTEEQKKDDNFPGEKEETKKEEEKQEEKKEEPKASNTVTLTTEQVKINNEITKLDTQIEDLEKRVVDVNDFYDDLDNILTDEEQQLEHEDKVAYFKLLDTKKQEYIDSNSKEEEVTKLKEEKQDLQKIYDRQAGIVTVTAKYPDFDYEKVMNHFERKLNAEEKEEVYKDASTYADVYENTYKLMNKETKPKVAEQKAPNIPDVNNIRKEDVNNDSLKSGLTTEEEELRDALGF